MSVRADALAPAASDIHAIRMLAFWGLIAAKSVGGWGVQWDIRWHLLIGRDSFWIAPHLMTYTGVTAGALLAFGMLALDTARARSGQRVPGGVQYLGVTGTRGFHLAWWGMAVTIVAAPIDDLWHRLFGLDVTLWSPPHLLGLAGAQINTLGCLAIALELWAAGRLAGRAALIVSGILLLGAFYITVDPGIQTAFRRGGVFFFTWAILGAAAFAFTFAVMTRLTAWRATPLALALGALLLHYVGSVVADAGFALTQPTPAIEEAIAADPDSPVALAWEMARRNGAPAPGRSATLRWLPVAPAALAWLLDARRRWTGAVLGVALVAVFGVALARVPSLAHALPSTVETVIALLLAALAGFLGAAAGAAFADRLRPVGRTAPA
ncbi:MAG TPA: hypothetical protein VID04_11760 [Methylomirabilota bacterium]